MAEIFGLPAELEVVPPAPLSPFDPDADAKREAWSIWRDEVLRYRVEHQTAVTKNPAMHSLEYELCRRSCAYFVTMWCSILEPRDGEKHRMPGEFEWIPFERQVELWDWLEETMTMSGADADGVVSKARDMGASWCFCAWLIWRWLFRDMFIGMMVSYKEDLVDSKSSRSLFWKIRFMLHSLPSWMRGSYDRNNKGHNALLQLINPENGNELVGESTNANAGVAARATAMVFDEGARIPGLLDLWAGATNTTSHRFALSTENLEIDPGFYRLTHPDEDVEYAPRLFVMEWWHNPLNNDEWLQEMRERFATEPGKFEREIERNPKAGNRTLVYPAADECEIGEFFYQRGDPLHICIDPGFDDDTAIIWLTEQDGKFIVLDAYFNYMKEAAFYGTILTGYNTFLDEPDLRFAFQYDPHDLDFMEWTRSLPRTSIVGDIYGDNVHGATADSFYDILRKSPFRLKINTDRTASGDVSANKRAVRQFKGRRESLRRMLRSMAFANTPGARKVLRALQEHKFIEESGKATSVSTRPQHDWTSHPVSALEYFAANWYERRAIHSAVERRSDTNTARGPRLARWSPYMDKARPRTQRKRVA